jgi:hypothetical protein
MALCWCVLGIVVCVGFDAVLVLVLMLLYSCLVWWCQALGFDAGACGGGLCWCWF